MAHEPSVTHRRATKAAPMTPTMPEPTCTGPTAAPDDWDELPEPVLEPPLPLPPEPPPIELLPEPLLPIEFIPDMVMEPPEPGERVIIMPPAGDMGMPAGPGIIMELPPMPYDEEGMLLPAGVVTTRGCEVTATGWEVTTGGM